MAAGHRAADGLDGVAQIRRETNDGVWVAVVRDHEVESAQMRQLLWTGHLEHDLGAASVREAENGLAAVSALVAASAPVAAAAAKSDVLPQQGVVILTVVLLLMSQPQRSTLVDPGKAGLPVQRGGKAQEQARMMTMQLVLHRSLRHYEQDLHCPHLSTTSNL